MSNTEQAQWRFIDCGERCAAENMALDEAMLIEHSKQHTPPTIRFYGWQPAALSIGYFQKAEQEVDLEGLQRHGVSLVRRITGGRAVLHEHELTYSMVLGENHPMIPSSVTEAYRLISEGLVLGYRHLGIDAQMSIPQQETAQDVRQRSAVCFDASSAYELVVQGRKAAGSAQTRQKGVLLQHGSILLDVDEDKMFDVLRFANTQVRERIQKRFHETAVTIQMLTSEKVSMLQVKQAFRNGLQEALGIQLVDGSFTTQEQQLAQRIKIEKYADDAWTFRK